MYAIGSNWSQTDRTEPTGASLAAASMRHAGSSGRRQTSSAANGGASDEAIATNVGVGSSDRHRTKCCFVLGNLEAALSEEPRPGEIRASSRARRKPCWAGIGLFESHPRPAPAGRWSCCPVNLSGLTAHASVSRETVRRRSTEIAPRSHGVRHVAHSEGQYADDVACMKDVDLHPTDPPDHPSSRGGAHSRGA